MTLAPDPAAARPQIAMLAADAEAVEALWDTLAGRSPPEGSASRLRHLSFGTDEDDHDGNGVLRVQACSPVLEMCDLVDLSCFTDPAAPVGPLERALDLCEAAIWCTSAADPWPSREALVWARAGRPLRARSMLAVDGLQEAKGAERRRLLRGLRRTTEGFFAECASLSEAAAPGIPVVVAEVLGMVGLPVSHRVGHVAPDAAVRPVRVSVEVGDATRTPRPVKSAAPSPFRRASRKD
ncbi:hypothetical protein [Tranquillimonas alkanivorans]|uniref:Uncharacterized protein n=1 Tax=Tranquillimonas alkanivorans TaxID=441119 RepID=A0A1I5M2J7_9RHOB|nr:hypothetical protein [Tranquillimonas alkanivorans]SFP03772.1 hypothetical protein SAMN04488047_10259 [Tranquillimonas alkanivorans]